MNDIDQIATVLRFIDEAKNGGDYHTANLLFVAALHFITRCKRNMTQLAEHCELEIDGGKDSFYDLLVIRAGHGYACIPVPMLADDIVEFCYANCAHTPRREHNRRPIPSTPDTWTNTAYGWVRTGKENMELFLSPGGQIECINLKARKIGFIEEETTMIMS